jgi:hypothetical protein
MAEPDPPEPGNIVQLSPTVTNRAFTACLMVVTEVRPWGVQGYVQALGESRNEPGGQAHYRANWGEFEATGGRAVWMTADSVPDDGGGGDKTPEL